MSRWWKRLLAAWMAFAHALGVVFTALWMTVIYWVVLPPFALIRWKDPLRRRLAPERPGEDSYWEVAPPHEPTVERCSHPF